MHTEVMKDEMIVLLDELGNETGTAPKLASHHASTPLHRAFSCYVFDENGRFLVTQRALSKKVWPGVWTNSVCGHPAPGEGFEAAIARRAEYELGMQLRDVQILLPDYRYMTPPFNGIIENEVCPVYIARIVSGPEPNPDEIEAYEWMDWPSYIEALQADPEKYSYWSKDQMSQLQNSALITEYSHGR